MESSIGVIVRVIWNHSALVTAYQWMAGRKSLVYPSGRLHETRHPGMRSQEISATVVLVPVIVADAPARRRELTLVAIVIEGKTARTKCTMGTQQESNRDWQTQNKKVRFVCN